MNQARRMEILEILVSNHEEFDFADFEMSLNPCGTWTAESRFVVGEIIAEHDDPVECYAMAVQDLEDRKRPKPYLQALENLVTVLAGTRTVYTKAEFKKLKAEARRILKLKAGTDG